MPSADSRISADYSAVEQPGDPRDRGRPVGQEPSTLIEVWTPILAKCRERVRVLREGWGQMTLEHESR
ncbi:MAG: hypothetical protein CL908_02010 [Deltaproteobacteria bacterium]|nr:hypothetical protein [Deltaproteobacteria bacterium]